MAKLRGLKGEVQLHSNYNTPRIIRNIPSESSNENPRKIAELTLMKIAPDLKIKNDLSDLKFDKVKKSILGSHVLYQQYLGSKPISGSWIRVDIDKKGKVYNIQSDLIPKSFLLKVKPKETQKTTKLGKRKPLSSKDVASIALKAAGSTEVSENKLLKKEQVYFPYKGVPTLAWKVIVETIRPRKEMKIYLDAISGKVLSKVNQLREKTGKGMVFDPNPVVALNNLTLKVNTPIPNSAYKKVSLNGLSGNGFLDGAFVSTKNTKKRIKRNDNKFFFTRIDRPFKEVMAYFHIDRLQRYIQELGFDNAMNHSINVDIAGRTDDNSDYSPEKKSLRFGTGGVDDAEDAEIILHEYGHAILDDQVPGFGETEEAASISEAFGDYVAASFFEATKTSILKPTIGTWDAVGYPGTSPHNSVRCLRRLDSKKKYPHDLSSPFDPHQDGEIWSACLWELRKLLGRKTADKLIIAHHFLLTRKATFNDAANAMIVANRNLNSGAKEASIRKIFTARGIL